MAAVSLSSAEAEELEPTGVFKDEAGCMGLVFGYPVYWFKRVRFTVDRINGAKFWRVAGIADYLVRFNQVRLVISPLQRRFK